MVNDRFAVSQIGLGSMGSAIGAAIASAGHDLTVWNRTEAKSHALVEHGAAIAESVGDAVSTSDLIAICVRG